MPWYGKPKLNTDNIISFEIWEKPDIDIWNLILNEILFCFTRASTSWSSIVFILIYELGLILYLVYPLFISSFVW